ncbi:DUF2507 domain-containing protein [Salibacterium aidingense]|uniref:DUF2507 domain-containing protein n=1 Tax=Salibacterium aidingense TaxID=384933 RepID=UPI000424A18D|nr:DUF2507 domain-containing protein [Salibacterium aidingense]
MNDFNYILLRETLLPALLGTEEADILYWGGKRIARTYPAETLEDISSFFEKAGWGNLALNSEKRKEMQFEMDVAREEKPLDRHLEAGFLAEQIERLKGKTAETYITEKRKRVVFQVQWD